MIAGHLEILALVLDLVDLCRIGKDPFVAIADNGTFFPAPFEELVENLDILLGDLVAVVVAAKTTLADILGAALEIGRDDIPADAPLGVVIGGREAARESVGMLERGRRRDADPEMLG